MNMMTIRSEQPADAEAIFTLTEAAFREEVHSDHTEQFIIDGLRRAGQLTVSLVAVEEENIIGHVAVSPVSISSGESDWYGLGPISVHPDRQRQGVGSQLMYAAMEKLQELGGEGCVLVGDPAFYSRFGFTAVPELVYPGLPPAYFQVIYLGESRPEGEVRYQAAFEAKA